MQAHEGQKRAITEAPFFIHILDVMKHLMSAGASNELIIAGIFHDTLEDTNIDPNLIKEQFGEKVYHLVEFMTEPHNKHDSTLQDLKETWKERKRITLEKARKANEEELTLLLADKLANSTSLRESVEMIGDETWNYFQASKQDIVMYHKELLNIFEQKLPHSMLTKLFARELKLLEN